MSVFAKGEIFDKILWTHLKIASERLGFRVRSMGIGIWCQPTLPLATKPQFWLIVHDTDPILKMYLESLLIIEGGRDHYHHHHQHHHHQSPSIIILLLQNNFEKYFKYFSKFIFRRPLYDSFWIDTMSHTGLPMHVVGAHRRPVYGPCMHLYWEIFKNFALFCSEFRVKMESERLIINPTI